jgi:hypothetical protein
MTLAFGNPLLQIRAGLPHDSKPVKPNAIKHLDQHCSRHPQAWREVSHKLLRSIPTVKMKSIFDEIDFHLVTFSRGAEPNLNNKTQTGVYPL